MMGPPPRSSVAALTTPFSPAADCFGTTYSIADGSNDTLQSSVSVYGFTRQTTVTSVTLLHGYTSSCYPEGASTAIFGVPAEGGGFFTPGYCPNGFTTASAEINNGYTDALCCPSYEPSTSTHIQHVLIAMLGRGHLELALTFVDHSIVPPTETRLLLWTARTLCLRVGHTKSFVDLV